jgi:flagellin
MTAMNSNRMLGITTSQQAKSTEKLSSGYKINRAADDAAGLSISEKMRKQIRGLTQATANAQDGISLVQTAEGALGEVHDMLQRMNELAIKAANGTMSSNDRMDVQREINSLVTEIDRVSTSTKFNETYLLKGSVGMKEHTTLKNSVEVAKNVDVASNTTLRVSLQVGADNLDTNRITLSIKAMDSKTLGLSFGNIAEGKAKTYDSLAEHQKNVGKEGSIKIDVTNSVTSLGAGAAIDMVAYALKEVSKQRSQLGAIQNRLEHTITNLNNVVENTTAAESAIRDTDMASEMVRYSKNNILAQAGQSMLAQANQSNQGVLSLLS